MQEIDLRLSQYHRGADGLIDNVEDLRDLMKRLLTLFDFFSPIVLSSIPYQARAALSMFFCGAYILNFKPEEMDENRKDSIKFLQELYGPLFEDLLGLKPVDGEALDANKAIQWAEEFFKRLGEK